MLLGSLFILKHLQESPGVITGEVLIDEAHPVFKGHFPSIPVVPGVCMVQLVKEVLEHVCGKKTMLNSASQIKFLTVITPQQTRSVQIKIEYLLKENSYDVQASLSNPDQSYFKLKGDFRIN